MSYDAEPRFRRNLSADLHWALTWTRLYLRTRTASDWVFFACGVALGHFLF